MTTRYGRKYGSTRQERGWRIVNGPRRILPVEGGYIVPSQRFPASLSYHVYMTDMGPHCGNRITYDNGCEDKKYRRFMAANCKHEHAVKQAIEARVMPTRASRRLQARSGVRELPPLNVTSMAIESESEPESEFSFPPVTASQFAPRANTRLARAIARHRQARQAPPRRPTRRSERIANMRLRASRRI
mgnify:FL=1